MSAFMIPEYTCEPFHMGDNKQYEGVAIPAEVWGTLERFIEEEGIRANAEIVEGKWWVRLSAPGYMDATDWHGPFEDIEAARAYVAEYWDVDADSGEELSDVEG